VSPAARLVRLTARVSRGEVRRALGYPDGRDGGVSAEAGITQLWGEAMDLLEPRGAYRLVDLDGAAVTGMPDPAAEVAVAVCTIGPRLEEAAQRWKQRGDLLAALTLDAIGSAAAEAAADALNARICTAAARRGLHAAPRVSPGYGEWDTSRQRDLLALLPIGELGITLTGGQMMVPRKSVSFAVNLLPEPPREETSRCSRCGATNCRHRREPFVGT